MAIVPIGPKTLELFDKSQQAPCCDRNMPENPTGQRRKALRVTPSLAHILIETTNLSRHPLSGGRNKTI